MKPFAEKFYLSKAWRKCRKSFYISKNGLCERCGKPGLIVHHKTKLTPQNINDPEITLSWSNLELLCQDCHNKEHGLASALSEGLAFDADGNLINTKDTPPYD